jgi:hypothetical protein
MTYRRRVKCDEETPCGNCVRRNEECSLLEPTPSSSSEAAPSDPALPSTSDEWISDLELMHHYTDSIADGGMATRPKVRHLWQSYIPRQALKHTFLMHGLLALSALHLAYQHPEEAVRYLRLCDKHQSIALGRFRSILSSSEFDVERADALFGLAAVISVSSMARSSALFEHDSDEKVISMDEVVELFILTRGVRDVIHLAHQHISRGPLAELFEGHV